MKTFLLIIISFLALRPSSAQPARVLFVGNSYTAYNNLPQLFTDLALSLGDTVNTYASNPGGYTFQMHTTNAATLALIDSLPWNYVFLQEQSQLPSFDPAQVAVDVYPYARMLDSLIHVNDSCTETVFYMTWGRKYGDASNCVVWPPVCTYTGMQERLRESYVEMANDNKALVAPAGQAWKASWMADSSINLWVADNSHPSLAGSYLTACVMYATLFRKPSLGAVYTAGLPSAMVSFLQQTADQTVFDSLSVWNIGDYDVLTQFTYTATGLQVQFSDQSLNADLWQWDFGDGSFSQQQNPAHAYAAPGLYMVQLISGNVCAADTFSTLLNVSASGIAITEGADCLKYTGDGSFSLSCAEPALVSVYFADGRLADPNAPRVEGHRIFLNSLHSGFYLIVVEDSNGRVYRLKWYKA